MSLVAENGVYRSPLLRQFPWLDHGFGGRNALNWPPEAHASLVQVHGATVVQATQSGPLGEGDALVTSIRNLYVAVRTADCLPLLMADVQQRKVASVHAGWRGTVAQISARTIEAMGSHPADVWVVIGPGIGRCCFEVGDEVAREFGKEGRHCIDLFEYNRQILLDFGVPAAQIDGNAPCTKCSPGEFHSFRRDKQDAGRMHSAIALL